MKHAVILIPGLSDDIKGLTFITRNWARQYGLTSYIFPMQWRDSKVGYEARISELVEQIDLLFTKGYKISLIGTSAGGSAAINAFCRRKNKINKVINICGRLRSGERVYPSLELAASSSLAFKASVLQCEKNVNAFSKEDVRKILTIRPLFDETVPVTLVPVSGAENIQIISVGHVLSIALSMTFHSKKIIEFLLRSG